MAELYDGQGKPVGSPTFCQKHWDMLREEVDRQGLAPFVAEDGILAARKLQSMSQHGLTIDNFDPLMKAHVEITLLAVRHGGVDGCPVESLVDHYNTDSGDPCTDVEYLEVAVRHQVDELEKLRLS